MTDGNDHVGYAGHVGDALDVEAVGDFWGAEVEWDVSGKGGAVK